MLITEIPRSRKPRDPGHPDRTYLTLHPSSLRLWLREVTGPPVDRLDDFEIPLTNDRLRLWLGAIFPAAVVLALVAYWAPVHAQPPDQLTVYSPQSTYSAAMLDIQGHLYVGLIELLEPLGSVEGRVDGKKYKLRFTPPGGHPVEAQFQEGKDKSKILSEYFKLPENFAQQNGRGYVPLSAVPEILTKLLAKPVQLHPSARR